LRAGPMPPPPLKWQPLQLNQLNRRLPSPISKALPSWRLAMLLAQATGGPPPGELVDITIAPSSVDWGSGLRYSRSSRLQPVSATRSTAAAMIHLMAAASPPVAPHRGGERRSLREWRRSL